MHNYKTAVQERSRGERAMPGSARAAERISAAIPISIEGGGKGETVNVSPVGIYFVTDKEVRDGGPLRLTLEFESASGKLFLECVGEIVRIESNEGKVGVAARITDSRLERRNGHKR
jgi:hypothetical protein